jgi:hypothetical protein
MKLSFGTIKVEIQNFSMSLCQPIVILDFQSMGREVFSRHIEEEVIAAAGQHSFLSAQWISVVLQQYILLYI